MHGGVEEPAHARSIYIHYGSNPPISSKRGTHTWPQGLGRDPGARRLRRGAASRARVQAGGANDARRAGCAVPGDLPRHGRWAIRGNFRPSTCWGLRMPTVPSFKNRAGPQPGDRPHLRVAGPDGTAAPNPRRGQRPRAAPCALGAQEVLLGGRPTRGARDLRAATPSWKPYAIGHTGYEFNNNYHLDLYHRPVPGMGCALSGFLRRDGPVVEVIELPNHPWFMATQFPPGGSHPPPPRDGPTRCSPVFGPGGAAAQARIAAAAGGRAREPVQLTDMKSERGRPLFPDRRPLRRRGRSPHPGDRRARPEGDHTTRPRHPLYLQGPPMTRPTRLFPRQLFFRGPRASRRA